MQLCLVDIGGKTLEQEILAIEKQVESLNITRKIKILKVQSVKLELVT